MPRGKLNEVYVKEVAVEWLANRYLMSLHPKAIVSGVEAWVSRNNQLGYGRADGLIAAQREDGTIYTVTIEAKSSRTWRNVNTRQRQFRMLSHAFVLAGIVSLMLILLGLVPNELFKGMILPTFGITIVGYFLLSFLPLSRWYRESDVVYQVMGYPANEKWIALSSDVFNKLVIEKQSAHFERICRSKGVGLIRIGSGRKCNVVIDPKVTLNPKNLDNFLSCYSRGAEVLTKLSLALREPKMANELLLLDEPIRSSEELNPDEIAESVINAEKD